MYAVASHEMQREKYHTEMPSHFAKTAIQVKVKLQVKIPVGKKHPDCDNANGNSQTGKFERQAKSKSNEKLLETLLTHCCILNIYLHKASFYFGFYN